MCMYLKIRQSHARKGRKSGLMKGFFFYHLMKMINECNNTIPGWALKFCLVFFLSSRLKVSLFFWHFLIFDFSICFCQIFRWKKEVFHSWFFSTRSNIESKHRIRPNPLFSMLHPNEETINTFKNENIKMKLSFLKITGFIKDFDSRNATW